MNEENISLQGLEQIVSRLIDYRKDRISLISSENVSSNLMRASYSLGLSDFYCSRLPENRNLIDNLTFSNTSVLDDLNHAVRIAVNDFFAAGECEVRPLSGVNGLTVLLFSLLERNDNLLKMADEHGGHLAVKPIAKRLGLNILEMRLGKDFRLDLDHFQSIYRNNKIKTIFLDSSYILFPYPVEEIRDIVGDDVTIVYDASHVIGLTAYKLFQDPFKEGADIIHSTLHKTFWGPQKSIILFNKKDYRVEQVREYVKELVSNTHLHHILALYISILEYREMGKEYAHNVIINAAYFSDCLQSEGFNVVAKKYGYTESNQLWIEFQSKEEACILFEKLEEISVSANVIFLPDNKWGWRLAVNDLTRRGAGKDFFKKLANTISNHIFEKKPITQTVSDITELQSSLKGIKYTLDSTNNAQRIINMIQSTL